MGPSIRTKSIFLSFLQKFYSGHPRLTWNVDPRFTKIIIADKFATDIGIAAMRPSIILDRGSISWTMRYRNEAFPSYDHLTFPKLNQEYKVSHTLTDQLQVSLTLNVLSKNPFSADELANEVFINLSGYREWFKEKGIHKFTSLGIGKENIVKVSATGVDVTVVPIQLSFIREQTIRIGERLFNCRVYSGGQELFEEIDFRITANGTQVEFRFPPTNPTIDYIDAVTLEEKLNKNLISDSQNNKLYTVPENGSIYGYYNLFENFIGYKEEDEWIKLS